MLQRLLVALSLVVVMAVPVRADAPTYNGFPIASVTVNGIPLSSDVPAIIVEGRTLLPVRAVANAVGAAVAFDPDTQTVLLTVPDIQRLQRDMATVQQQAADATNSLKAAQAIIASDKDKIGAIQAKLDNLTALNATLVQPLSRTVFRDSITSLLNAVDSQQSSLVTVSAAARNGTGNASDVVTAAQKMRGDLQSVIVITNKWVPPGDGFAVRQALLQWLQTYYLYEDAFARDWQATDNGSITRLSNVLDDLWAQVSLERDAVNLSFKQWLVNSGT